MSESQSEIEEAFSQCLNIIDNPPAEHRIAKHAIQGAILLSIHRKDLISKIYFKLLQVVKDAQTYRLNPRVCAVREISYLTYHDEQLAPPAIQFLQSLLPCDDFNSQQISRAAVVSLSRIARMHVVYQPNVIQTIRQIYQNSSKKFLRAEALIGIARMSQRNHSLRTEFASEFIKCAHDKNEHIKCAAISALSHAVVALENVPRDEGLEQRCFEICSAQLRTAPRTEHTRYESDWHLVHLSAIKALALLVRAAPSAWWTPVAQVFERVLADPREPWLSKCGVVWMSGKLSALFAAECQDYKLTCHLLLEAVKHDHTMLVESAVHGLVHLSLAHTAQYSETRDWIKSKLGTSFKHTSGMTLALYLRPWCKLIARAVNPLFQALTARMEPLVARSYSTQLTIKAPEHVDEDMRRSVREPEPVVEKTFKLDVRHMEQTVRPIARDDQQLWRVCSEFSASVLESLVAMLRDMTLLDDQQLVQHVKLLILDYKNKVQQSKAAPDPALHLHYKELAQMDLLARETAVTILRFPQVLDDAHWLGSVKQKFTAPQHHQSRAHSTPSQRGGYPMQHGVSTMQSAPPALVPPPLPFNPPGPVQQQQQQQLLQLLSLTNPALLMQLNAHNNAALLQTLQQQAVLTALQQNALTNPARDPRLNTAVYAPAPYAAGPYQPAPYQPPEHYNNNTRGSYNNNRGRGAHRGRGGTDQGYKRPRDDVYQGPDSKRAKYSHSASQPPTGPSSVNGVPGSSNSVNGASSGPDQSESGSAAPRAFTELSSNTSAQTTPELEATVPPPESVNHVPHVKQEIESDVVTLGSDSEEEPQMTGVKSSSESDSDDEEGEISSEGDASGLPGPGVQSVNASSARKKRKRKKKGKKKASNEREVCKYFVTKNSCSKGQDCPYLHPAGHKLDEVCRFYRSGVCRRGDECIYSHDLSREACKHMVQGACLYGDRCRFSHDPAVVEAQRLITPPSHKTRVKQAEPVSSAPVVTPLNSQVLHPISALPVVPFVAQQRDPRLDPTLTSQLSLTNSIAPPATTPVRTASPEPLSTPFGLSLLTTLTPTQSTPRSNVADELKKLL